MNKVILIGNLTRDPELSQTQSGISMCRFSIAVNRNFTNANGERETDFFNITVWRGLAENCAKYLAKGRKVCVVGSLQNRSYEDKDGNRRTVTDVVAEDVEFLSARNDDGASAPAAPQERKQSAPKSSPKKTVSELTPLESEDLPF